MRARDRIALSTAEILGPHLLRGLAASLKFDVVGENHLGAWKAGRPVVFVSWHGRLLPLLYLFRQRGIVMLVSGHRDGEYLSRVGRRLGYLAVRGSSTEGGYGALRQMVRQVEAGRSLAITPDGPQGPMERFKPGALQVARLTGSPLIPLLAGCRDAWWIEGWDSFMVPKPFASVRVAVGEPRLIPSDTSLGELERHARALEAQLRTLKDATDDGGRHGEHA